MRVLVTGADGFIGKNLLLHLQEMPEVNVVCFTRNQKTDELPRLVQDVDWVFHLAGVNRPENSQEFIEGNADLTLRLCEALRGSGKAIPVVYSSSIQVELDNDYGRSKRAAEDVLLKLQRDNNNPVFIYRLPNVFGKWARPNYNSVVATFCHNLARDLPIHVNDPSSSIKLVYIDDVINNFIQLITLNGKISPRSDNTPLVVSPEYQTTVGELASQLSRFRTTRDNLITEAVGTGFIRALYATYVSYLPPELFTYAVQRHCDERGVFVEMLKTHNAGQFSFFTAHPGFTRGGHYHHTKTEKFLVIKGEACFRFRHVLTDDFFEIYTSGDSAKIVETVPGWTHDVTNIGNTDLICMLWANEIFERDKPDTYFCPVVIGD